MKYFSMFSGIGGFEYGMEQSKHNFECVGFCEVDKYAISIYTRHFPTHKNYGDATRIHTEKLPDFDFLVGGFPCQAFSLAGKRKGFDDTRGTLFFEIARILKDKRPGYFLLENVKGLLSHESGKTFQTILKVLTEMEYYIEFEVLNSKNFGVPQNRERIFIKGYFGRECGGEILFKRRKGEKTNGKLKPLNNKAQSQTIYDINGVSCTLSANGGGQGGKTGLYKINEPSLKQINNNKPRSMNERVYDVNGLAKTLCGDGGGFEDKTGVYLLNGTVEGNIATLDANYHKGLGPADVKKNRRRRTHIIENNVCKPVLTPERENKRQNGRRMKEDGEPSFTLTATDRHGVYDGYRIRRLTPVECERLQGFPDNWTQYGKDDELISDTQRYKCCGNAVTTTVITAIVDEMFDGVEKNGV